jgi:hypothetical protein
MESKSSSLLDSVPKDKTEMKEQAFEVKSPVDR